MKKAIQYIILGTIIFTLLSIIVPRKYFYNPVKQATLVISMPFNKLFSGIYFSGSNLWYKISNIRRLAKENQDLKNQVDQLNQQVSNLIEVKNENDILRQQLGFAKSREELQLLTAEVIGRDPNNFLQKISINKGSKQGVTEGLPVVSGGYMIGKIADVQANSSSVILITNPNSVVNAMVQESRATGTVKGDLGYGLKLELVPMDVKINVGDNVVTSGIGDTFPRGLIIGKITQVQSIKSDIFQTAEIRPEVNINKLEIVFVVIKQ